MRTIVMAHRGTESTCQRHAHLWKQFGPVQFISPLCGLQPGFSDVIVGTPTLYSGIASHHSFVAIRRFSIALQTLYDTEDDYYWFNEYDSFALAIPSEVRKWMKREWPLVCGNLFDNVHDPKFKGHQFVHPPLLFNRAGLKAVIGAFSLMDDSEEGGFWDRLLGLLLERAAIPCMPYGEYGYSENTIHDPAVARAKAAAGAKFFHGVKDAQVYRAIMYGAGLTP